jgi:glucose/arabinose dehydrogenase
VSNEQGLVGVALSPRFDDGGFLYAYATRATSSGARNHLLRSRIDENGRAAPFHVLVDVMPAGERHNGGRILFGPDGSLYAATGDSGDPSLAQDPDVNAGKILRIEENGSVPNDNPWVGSPVFASGIRNSFGLAFDPATGRLWESENGPECNDELNRVGPQDNLGWGPAGACTGGIRATNADGVDPVLPELSFARTIAPTGLVFCDGCGLGSERELHLFYGSFNTGEIHEVTLGPDRKNVIADEVAYRHRNVVLSLEHGPDGSLYFSDGLAIYQLALARQAA